ncbi:MAG: hypothetical protein J5I98_29590 [Phaeodactylibacter sp.]|nr:hypothetical protein [Phaeodactylibacter sp.]
MKKSYTDVSGESIVLNKIKLFKTMAAIIAFMITLGVITSSSQATPELIQQYEDQYKTEMIGSSDLEIM